MHKRLIIVSAIILIGLCGLSALGYYSIGLHAEGLAARRANEFVATAEQIRLDVKRKLDRFIKTEENRPYTDYQYFYVPTASNDTSALVRSPLAQNIRHGLAYGHFQLESDGTIVSPFNKPYEEPTETLAKSHIDNLKSNLLTALAGNGSTIKPETVPLIAMNQKAERKQTPYESIIAAEKELTKKDTTLLKDASKKALASKSKATSPQSRQSAYRIQSLDEPTQKTQVLTKSRANVERNIANTSIYDNMDLSRRDSYQSQQPVANRASGDYGRRSASSRQRQRSNEQMSQEVSQSQLETMPDNRNLSAARQQSESQQKFAYGGTEFTEGLDEYQKEMKDNQPQPIPAHQTEDLLTDSEQAREIGQITETVEYDQTEDMVQVRIEPFQSIVVPGANEQTRFPGQIFLLRHVQIEQKHFLQGFKLDETELVRQLEESAGRHVVRRDMGFDVGTTQSYRAAHTAILDFGFGDLVLNLFEQKPNLIASQVSNLKKGFFAIAGVVFIAVMLAQASLWRTAKQQIKLAKKKDDFISAVSHELRTPLTTIRMHTEMLEKGWIKSEDKKAEYYSTMRQESERLTRLIENVLDFSRIQRGRKKYNFKLGDINNCISDVIDMMTPCASQAGFTIEKKFTIVPQFAFDPDAVMQIVINLLDNAIKYAHNAKEKVITVHTEINNGYVLIEVEDHGPGIPRLQKQKVFDEFYRCGDESRRETTGTGLGLALVKKFALAHQGFVEIINAKPQGAIFRVALTDQLE